MTAEGRVRAAADALPLQLTAGRLVIAAALLAVPVPAVRMLGTDTATARRVSWLTRMLAVRDGAIATGGLATLRRGSNPAPWLLAGAVSDAVDAVVLDALRARRLRGPIATLGVPGGAAAAILGAFAALRRR